MLPIPRRSRAGSDERGAVAVEFALVVPLIILLTLAIIEFGLLLRDFVSLTNVTRESVRVASAQPKKGLSSSSAAIVASHSGTSADRKDWSFAYEASQVLASRGSAIPESSIVDMWVYIANKKGFPLNSTSAPADWATDTRSTFDGGCPEASCVRYSWDDTEGTFYYRSGLLRPSAINACVGSPSAMSVGVFMRVQHRSIVGSLLGTDMTISDSAVTRFEPMRNILCAAS